jgi:hypothetical protein
MQRRATDVSFTHDCFEQDKQVEIGSREIDVVQHIAEIVPLASQAQHRDSQAPKAYCL